MATAATQKCARNDAFTASLWLQEKVILVRCYAYVPELLMFHLFQAPHNITVDDSPRTFRPIPLDVYARSQKSQLITSLCLNDCSLLLVVQ